jgi:DNA polymerase III delta prime subunit
MSDLNRLLLAEKYRPKTIDECILPEATKRDIKNAIASGDIPNLVLYGGPGSGKTSLCYAIANETNSEILYINASMERSIDVIRNQVMTFSSTISLTGSNKIVLFDESDGLTTIAQNSIKSVTEQFAGVRFFFTSNHVNKIIEPIKSRCVNINFKIDPSEKPKIAAKFFKRVTEILDNECIEYEKPVVAELVNKYFPDFRRTLNEIQRCAAGGKIDAGVLIDRKKESIESLVASMKQKNFTEVRKWVAQNSDIDPQVLFKDLYVSSTDLLEPQCIPQVVLILSDYSFKSTHSVDSEILMTAALVELMVACTWK